MARNDLKKLEGEDKKNYLNNLKRAIDAASSNIPNKLLYSNLQSLIAILEESRYVEINPVNGLPSPMSILGIEHAKKNLRSELAELRGKINSGIGEASKDLEENLAEKIKEKIYSFDTFVAKEMKSEKTPLYELFNPEFTLRERLHLLEAVKSNDFTTGLLLKEKAGIRSDRPYFELKSAGFDHGQNSFNGYDVYSAADEDDEERVLEGETSDEKRFLSSLKKLTFFDDNDDRKLKPKYLETIEACFSKDLEAGYKNLEELRQEIVSIKHFFPVNITKFEIRAFYDKHTGEVERFPFPKDFLDKQPDAFVLDAYGENITFFEKYVKERVQLRTKKTKKGYIIAPTKVLKALEKVYKKSEHTEVIEA